MKGIAHDRDVLLSEILQRNDDSAVQGRQDSDVFEPAVTLAIEARRDETDIETAPAPAASD